MARCTYCGRAQNANNKFPAFFVFFEFPATEGSQRKKVENIKYGKAVAPKRKDVHIPDIPDEYNNFKI